MGKYKLNFTRKAVKDIQAHRKSGNKTIIKHIDRILTELEEHPQTGTGNPEQLKYDYSGYWSRRLSSEHRMIYRIEEDVVEVFVVSATGHYE